MSVPLAEPGHSFTAHFSLNLDGSLELDVNKSGSWGVGQGELILRLTGSGLPPSPYAGGDWGRVVRDLANPAGNRTDLPPSVIPLTIPMPNGEFVGFNYTMLVSGTSLVSNQAGFLAPGFGTTDGSFRADLGQSLTWGGIVSVTDNQTGLPVTGWTITSTSGFDYSQPAPEPATALMLGVGSLTLAAIGRRRQPPIPPGIAPSPGSFSTSGRRPCASATASSPYPLKNGNFIPLGVSMTLQA